MAIKNNWDYPNAFYVDGLDYEGTIRTGTRLK